MPAPSAAPLANVDRLTLYHSRAARLDPPEPSRSAAAGSPVVEQLLNRKTPRGRTYYLVRRQGRFSADDSWEPMERLAPFPERIAEYEAAATRRPPP